VNELSVPSTPRNLPLRLLVPLGALAAMAAFSGRDVMAGATAEGLYLAVLAAAALLPVGWLAPDPAWELGLGAVLATAAVWALPPGPGRGAAVVLVLAAALAVAAARRLSSALPADGLAPGVAPSITIPLALGLQILLRGELLLAPSLSVRLVVALLVLPVAGALAVTLLARRHGAVLPLIAAGTALTLAPGFNAASTLALLALAAGDTLGRQDLRWPVRAGALAVVLAPIAWQPGFGVVIAACGLALAWPRAGLALAVLAAAGMEIISKRPPNVALLNFSALPLLVPAALIPERRRIWNVLAAALLVATAPLVPDLSTLAAPLALAALSLRRDIAFTVPQRVWTGALLGGTALLASYPWLRQTPMTTALAFLGMLPGPPLAIWIVTAVLGLAALGLGAARTWSEPVRAARLAGLSGACLMLALLQGLPTAGTPLLTPRVPVELDAGHPAWETALPPSPAAAVGSVVVESYLANGAALARGTPVAVVKLVSAAGRGVDWTLRAGDDTGEWAARRPDVAGEAAPAPAAWVSWVAEGFFAQRYRSRLQLDRPEPFVRLRIERAPGVPANLTIALYQVEIRR
jgi:hypothetical protein